MQFDVDAQPLLLAATPEEEVLQVYMNTICYSYSCDVESYSCSAAIS